MKNLMIFVSPTHSFDNPHPDLINDAATLIKIQIDNSLSLGWKKTDILIFTNFEYHYGGIRTKVLKDWCFSKQDVDFIKEKPRSSKFVIIAKLFEKGVIGKDIYWSHDLDAFQLQPIKESELGLEKSDIGSVDSFADKPGGRICWNSSSFFFKSSAKDIFMHTRGVMYKMNVDEEIALNLLSSKDDSVMKRIKKLNHTYDLKRLGFDRYISADKPIKVAHFHPNWVIGSVRALDKFMGENQFHISLIPKRLQKIFKRHGIIPSK